MVGFLEIQFDCFGNRKVLLIDVIKKLHKMEKRLVFGKGWNFSYRKIIALVKERIYWLWMHRRLIYKIRAFDFFFFFTDNMMLFKCVLTCVGNARAFVKKKGRNNVTVDDLVHVIMPKGRGKNSFFPFLYCSWATIFFLFCLNIDCYVLF